AARLFRGLTLGCIAVVHHDRLHARIVQEIRRLPLDPAPRAVLVAEPDFGRGAPASIMVIACRTGTNTIPCRSCSPTACARIARRCSAADGLPDLPSREIAASGRCTPRRSR